MLDLDRGEVTQLYHINAGTTVTADKPVQVQFIIGTPYTGAIFRYAQLHGGAERPVGQLVLQPGAKLPGDAHKHRHLDLQPDGQHAGGELAGHFRERCVQRAAVRNRELPIHDRPLRTGTLGREAGRGQRLLGDRRIRRHGGLQLGLHDAARQHAAERVLRGLGAGHDGPDRRTAPPST